MLIAPGADVVRANMSPPPPPPPPPSCASFCWAAAAAAAAAVVADCTDQNLLSNWPVGSCGSGAGAVASKIAQNCLARKIQNYLAYYCAAASKLDQSCCAYLYQS
mmetsp:Transcript_33746/g.54429  ORF Transcript_33746/g.54429 Transcript_33746/m.54429 type:complete len:105 (+) Transcript_33746:1349-1663(+)